MSAKRRDRRRRLPAALAAGLLAAGCSAEVGARSPAGGDLLVHKFVLLAWLAKHGMSVAAGIFVLDAAHQAAGGDEDVPGGPGSASRCRCLQVAMLDADLVDDARAAHRAADLWEASCSGASRRRWSRLDDTATRVSDHVDEVYRACVSLDLDAVASRTLVEMQWLRWLEAAVRAGSEETVRSQLSGARLPAAWKATLEQNLARVRERALLAAYAAEAGWDEWLREHGEAARRKLTALVNWVGDLQVAFRSFDKRRRCRRGRGYAIVGNTEAMSAYECELQTRALNAEAIASRAAKACGRLARALLPPASSSSVVVWGKTPTSRIGRHCNCFGAWRVAGSVRHRLRELQPLLDAIPTLEGSRTQSCPMPTDDPLALFGQ